MPPTAAEKAASRLGYVPVANQWVWVQVSLTHGSFWAKVFVFDVTYFVGHPLDVLVRTHRTSHTRYQYRDHIWAPVLDGGAW